MLEHEELLEQLLQQGDITDEQIRDARGQPAPAAWLAAMGLVSAQRLLEVHARLLGRDYVILSREKIEPAALRRLPAEIIRRHHVLPYALEHGALRVAMADPLDRAVLDDVRLAADTEVVPVLAGAAELALAVRQYLAFGGDPLTEQLLAELPREPGAWSRAPNGENATPVIRVVDAILRQAVRGQCSDIHLEPQSEHLRVRLRVDGELYELPALPHHLQSAVVSRLKIMAELDIAEKRLSQDGHFGLTIDGKEIDFRVSTLPTIHGEKMVLRVLDRGASLLSISRLGLSAANHKHLLALTRRPYGLLLVTGPTGSGKTTALYALLNEINALNRNIVTLEDPVEYSLAGINQVQVNPKAGFDFANGLRSILRQDPDVIMVGEMRDRATAELGVQAALTGHLVLATLHTNHAAGAVTRLTDMGLEGFLLAEALIGIMSQRLVRCLCPHCRAPYRLEADAAARLGLTEAAGQTFYRSQGCGVCRQIGYSGRMALHELLLPGPEFRRLTARAGAPADQREAAARREGMIDLKTDALTKARAGLTSLEEIVRVFS